MAVYWVARAIRGGMRPEEFAKEYEMTVERVRAALAYAAAYPEEIEADIAHAEANRAWLESLEAAVMAPRKTPKRGIAKEIGGSDTTNLVRFLRAATR